MSVKRFPLVSRVNRCFALKNQSHAQDDEENGVEEETMQEEYWHVSKRNSYILVFYMQKNYYGAKYLIKYVRVHELLVDFIPMSRTK